MTVKPISPCQAFDVNQQLSGAQAAEFRAAGFEACIRYIPRTPSLIKNNLTSAEISAILGAGLALGAVQHVAMPGWQPTGALGGVYGDFAAIYSTQIGLPKGMNIWLDLEEVAAGASVDDVRAYCHTWFNEVAAQGFVPGIYVGYNVKLSDADLYSLPFRHYWKAYNCDQNIPTRGWQILQHPQKTLGSVTYDPNTIQKDLLNDLPIFVTN